MSTVSELFPAGGGDNTIDMVASGTLPNGSPVILKADGTVEVVGGSSIAESIPAGSSAIYNAGSTDYTSITFDPNNANKFVIAYRDSSNSNYGTAIVGTVSGTSITFGSEYVFNSGSTAYISAAFDPNNAGKFVVTYQDGSNSSYGTAVVGTMSGTSISFSSEYVFDTASTSNTSVAFDPNTAGKFVVAYKASNTHTIVGNVSGTSITFGSAVQVDVEASNDITISFSPTVVDKFVIVYRYWTDTGYNSSNVCTLSGTSISIGTAYFFKSGYVDNIKMSLDPNNTDKFVIVYRDHLNSGYGTAIVGSISGTSLSYSSEYVFNTANTYSNSIAFDTSTNNTFILAYKDEGSSNYGKTLKGTISGTTINFGTEATFNSVATYSVYTQVDPNSPGKFVVIYRDSNTANHGTAILGQLGTTTTNLTSTNLLGITKKAAVDGATVAIETLGGYVDNQSGLTIGSDYYVATDGSLTTTSTDNVRLGRAVTATSINIRNYV